MKISEASRAINWSWQDETDLARTAVAMTTNINGSEPQSAT